MQALQSHARSLCAPWLPRASLVPPKSSLVTFPGPCCRCHAVFLARRGCAALAQRGAAQRSDPPGAPWFCLRDPHGPLGSAAAPGEAGKGFSILGPTRRAPEAAPGPRPRPRAAEPGPEQEQRPRPGGSQGGSQGRQRPGITSSLPHDRVCEKTSLACANPGEPGVFQPQGMTWLQLEQRKGRRCSRVFSRLH